MAQILTVDDQRGKLKNGEMNEVVGHRIRSRRVAQKLTQEELAKKAKVTANTVRGLEKGRLRTRWGNFEQICRALGTTPEEMLREDTPIEPTDPRLEKLTDEDLRMGRLFHDASTTLRQRVRHLLRDGETDRATRLAERMSLLPTAHLDRLEQLVADTEAAVTSAQRRKRATGT